MSDKEIGPSTRELVSEAERLRSDKKAGRTPRTRQLLKESERLIGREGKNSRLLWVVLGIAVAGGLGYVIFLTMAG